MSKAKRAKGVGSRALPTAVGVAVGGTVAKTVVVKTVTKKAVGRVRHTAKVNNSAQVVLDEFVGDEINVAELPGILSEVVYANNFVLDLYLDTNLDLSEAEQDALSYPVDGEELMEMSVLSEKGLNETSVISTDCLTSHKNYWFD